MHVSLPGGRVYKTGCGGEREIVQLCACMHRMEVDKGLVPAPRQPHVNMHGWTLKIDPRSVPPFQLGSKSTETKFVVSRLI
jgi:hypothetical protein